MGERPFYPPAWQIPALLDGRAVRIVVPLKVQPPWRQEGDAGAFLYGDGYRCGDVNYADGVCEPLPFAPGDVLVCKEAWYREDDRLFKARADTPSAVFEGELFYKADDPNLPGAHWQSPATMAAQDVRLRLRVIDVAVKRVDELTREECIELGATSRPKCSGFGCRYDGWSMDWSDVGKPSRWASMGAGGLLTEADVCLASPQTAFGNAWNARYGRSIGFYADQPWVATGRVEPTDA